MPGTPSENSHFENFSAKMIKKVNQTGQKMEFDEKSHMRIFIGGSGENDFWRKILKMRIFIGGSRMRP